MAESPHGAGPSREQVFVRLVGEFGPALGRLTQSYEGDPALREDLLQEILLAVWQAIPQFRGEASERTWLYRIAHNTAISALISGKRRRAREQTIPPQFDPPSQGETPDGEAARHLRREALFAAVRELPLADRRVVTLHLDGLSYAEIEQTTGLSQSAIATRLSRARTRLAERMNGKEARR
jgi:RNA polymerase sigma factor (sigma-70 family)